MCDFTGQAPFAGVRASCRHGPRACGQSVHRHRRQPRHRPRDGRGSAPRAPMSARGPRRRRSRPRRPAPRRARAIDWPSTSPPRRRSARARGVSRGASARRRHARQQRRHELARARSTSSTDDGLAGAVGAARDGADAADARARAARWPSAAGGGSSTSPRPPASARRCTNAAYSVTKAAQLSLSRVFADATRPGRARQRGRARRRGGSSCGSARAGSPTRLAERTRASAATRRWRRSAAQDPARPPGRAGRDRRRRRVPVLGARLERDRRGVVGRRRHVPTFM